MDEKLKHEEPSQVCTHRQDDVVVGELQNSSTEHAATLASLQKQNTELRQQNECLSMELSNMQKKFEHLEDQLRRATYSCESHLRLALCDNSSSADDLKQAINASEALLNEAKREHANKKFRAKRAALEGLEVAVDKGEEETLSAAIAVAQQVDVDAVDLEKAEKKLKTLRAMTQKEHAAKAAGELLQKKRKTAFMYVKRDDVMKFKELLDEVGEGVSWCDWRDPLGRTLRRCAKDLQAQQMQKFLKQLGVGDEQHSAKRQLPTLMQRTTMQIVHQIEQQHHQQHQEQQRQEDMNQMQCTSINEHTEDAPVLEQKPTLDLSKCLEDHSSCSTHSGRDSIHSGNDSSCSTPCMVGDLIAVPHRIEQQQQWQEQQPQKQQEDMNKTHCIPANKHKEDTPANIGMYSNCSTTCPAEDTLAIAKSKAFRAAAQNDLGTLNEIIESVSIDTWSKWENRAGKTLLTLSEERRSTNVHSQLARALGIVRQSKCESFEEGETVWVYIEGDVQPKRATVLADTLDGTDVVPIEYWDGNEPATCVDRCTIHKTFS